MEIFLTAAVGYFTPLVCSLLVKSEWNTKLRFLVAGGIAAAAAALFIAGSGGVWASFDEVFTRMFAVQQATYQLKLPGAGDVALNETLRSLGSAVPSIDLEASVELEADPDDDEE